LIAGLLPAASLLDGCKTAQHPVLTLSIAASLQDAIVEIESSYNHEHGTVDFRNNFGSSGTLAGEIEQGAPVDAIISAGPKPIDDLQARGLLKPGTRINLLRNSLVLIAPQDSKVTGFDDLTSAAVRTVALGDSGFSQALRQTSRQDRPGKRCTPGVELRGNRECRCRAGLFDGREDLSQGPRGGGCARVKPRSHRVSTGHRDRNSQ